MGELLGITVASFYRFILPVYKPAVSLKETDM